MKRLLALLLITFTLTASAEPFKLGFDNKDNEELYVKYNEKDWEFVAHQDNWSLYLARGEVEEVKGFRVMFSMVVFDEGVKYEFSPKLAHRIFSFGMIHCEAAKLFMLNDFVTTNDHLVIFAQSHNFGEYSIDLKEKNTPRNKLHSMLCGKSI